MLTLVKYDRAINALTDVVGHLTEAAHQLQEAKNLSAAPLHAGLYVDEKLALRAFKLILDASAEVRQLRLQFEKLKHD